MRPDLFLATIGRGSNGSNALEVTEDRAAVTAESQDNIINRVNNLSQYGPSWHYVPGIGVAGTAYAEVPGSALGDLTFTRASSKTRTNSAGVVETIGNNVPPHDYRNADGTLSTFPRLNFEPQRTNSFLNSLLVGGIPPTNWQRPLTGGTLTAVSSIYGNADGATALQFVVSSAQDCIESSNISIVSGSTYTFSVYIESITGNIQANNFMRIAGGSTGTATYKINGQTISNTTNITAGLFELNFAATASTVNSVRIGAGNGLGAVTATLRISRPQAELGAYSTSRISTTTAAVTRLVDTASKTGVSSLIGQTQGTLFCEVNIRANKDSVRALQVSDGTLNNRIQLAFNANNFTPAIITGGVSQASFTVPFTAGNNKIAIAYANNDIVVYLNGSQVGTDNSATIPACSLLDVGQSIGGTNTLGDTIAQAALFPTRLTNDQLEVLTSEGYGTYALLAQSLNCVLQ